MATDITPSAVAAQKSDTAEELKRFALQWPLVLNERDADFASPRGQEIRATIAPEFTAVLDSYPGRMSWEELLKVWAQEHVEYPHCKLDATGCQADVDEKKGTAKVYIELDMKFVERVDLKAMTELKWVRYDDGRWMVKSFYLMRGHRGSTGFV